MINARQILIVEGLNMVREGLAALLSDVENFEVIAQAENGLEAIKAYKQHKPDVVVMGLSMPKMDGIETTRQLKRYNADVKILILTGQRTEKSVRESLIAGATGFLDKDCNTPELIQAINSTYHGNVYISPRITDVIVTGFLGKSPELTETSYDKLSDRERQILKLVAEGVRNKDIAECLFISQKTVEKHRSNVMKKLNLHNVPALTAYCIERGFVDRVALGY